MDPHPSSFSRVTLPGVVLLTSLVACGDDPPPPPAEPPPPVATPAATAASAPSASATATASASASGAKPMASVDAVSKEPRKWNDYAGPEIPPSVDPGKRAWAVVPVSVGWDTLKLRTLELSRVEGHLGVFSVDEGGTKIEYFVPGAFIAPTKPPAKPTAGEAVIASVHGSRAYARILGVKGEQIEVRYQFAGLVEQTAVDPSDVIELEGGLQFGSPVAYSELKEGARSERKLVYRPATFVQASEEKVWIVTASGKPLRVPMETVKPLGVHLSHKTGDKVWVARGDELVPGKVLEVLDDSLRYKLELEDATQVSSGFENVAPPIR